MKISTALRATFDREAKRYHRARPAPPEALVNAMLGRGSSKPGAHIREVGWGTSQATRPLAERRLKVHALELGLALAELARANLNDLDVTVETTAFEDYRSELLFDALLSVQAFHWTKPETGLAHAASLLRPGGALLLAWHRERSQYTAFYGATDSSYKAYEAPLGLNRPTPNGAPERFTDALETFSDFGDVQMARFAWTLLFDKTRYLELLLTYSNVQALEPSVRERLLAEIAAVIDDHGGQVERFYESVLLSAIKLA